MKYVILVATLVCSTILAQTSDWERRLAESRELSRKGQYLEAHRLLSELVEHANGLGVTNEALALALNDLGGVCVAMDRYHEAQWAYEKSLRLLLAGASETNGPDPNEAK